MGSLGMSKGFDWRWAIPIITIFSITPVFILIWNADTYEARHFLPISMLARLSILLLTIFSLDYAFSQEWAISSLQKGLSIAIGVVIVMELLTSSILIRNQLIFPAATAIMPEQNIIHSWGVDDVEYQVYQHIPLDETVIVIQTDIVDEQAYPRRFLMEWGNFGVNGEVIEWQGVPSITYRNTPQLETVAGPKGPVFGPYPLPTEAGTAMRAWRDSMLPGYLHDLGIRYVYVGERGYQLMPRYQRAVLNNPALYTLIAKWDHPATGSVHQVFETVQSVYSWQVLATGDEETLGLSPELFTQYEAFTETNGGLPRDAQVFMPATGAGATQEQAIQALAGTITATSPTLPDDNQHAQFALLQVHSQTAYQADLTLDEQEEAALTQWRNDKLPEGLILAEFDYLLISQTWWQWLSFEEQSVIDDPENYELLRSWGDELPEWYRLYRVVGATVD